MIWLPAHSLALLALSFGALASSPSGSPGVWAVLLAAEAIVAFGWLFAEAGRPARAPANAITSVRLLAAIGMLAALAPTTLPVAVLVALVVLGVIAEITDFFDGLIARRFGPTAFGARLDMETDALFMLALSLFAIRWFALPAWVSVAGLLRYAVAVPFLFLPEPRFPSVFSRFAKSACAVAAVLLVAAILPGSDFRGARIAATVVTPTIRLLLASAATGLLLVSFGWEAVIRLRALGSRTGGSLVAGLMKSVLTYYGVPFRQFAMRRFYACFVSPGDLVFDVGAHVGNRIAPLRGLGARVVAVEPQPHCCRLLRRHFAGDSGVVLVEGACGGTKAQAELRISSANPTLSTLSERWVESIGEHYAEHHIEWDHSIAVTMTTLDALIAEHGSPSFVKIDVEGFEHEVLSGLSSPVPVISFEFLPASLDPAIMSIALVERLGDYEFNYSMVETMRFAGEWADGATMKATLLAMRADGRSGDVYARRRTR